jgi:hypothetical protein
MFATARRRRRRPRVPAIRFLPGPGHAALAHPVHLKPPPLRTADGHSRDERQASWLELFFDLVFARAVGQLAGA